MALRDRAYRGLKQIPRVRLMSPASGSLATALVSFALPAEIDSRALFTTLLDKHHIQVRGIGKKYFNGLRLSPHLFNTAGELERVAELL